MIPEIKILEKDIVKYQGQEAVIHIFCNGISSEAYLPDGWNRPYFSQALTFILDKLLERYNALTDLQLAIIPVDEFINTSTPKNKAIQAVQELRDAYIHEYLNND